MSSTSIERELVTPFAEGAPERPVSLRSTESRAEWTEVLNGLEGATPFHSWAWLEWVAPLLNCRFVALVVDDADGRPVGVLPLLLKRRGPFQTANWVPFPYLGPLVHPLFLGATLDALRQLARRERLVNLQIAASPFTPAAAETCARFREHRFEVHLDETYVIPLAGRTLDEVRHSMSRSARQKLTSLTAHGAVELRRATPAEIAHVLPGIESAALSRQRLRSPYSIELGITLAQRPPRLALRVTSAVVGGTTVGVIAALGGSVTVGWIGGVLEQYRDTHASLALYWDIIAWAHASGSDYMDLVGVPTPGIAAFKKQFGGELRSYPVGRRSSGAYRQLMRYAAIGAPRR